MSKHRETQSPLLSKWWQSASAQAAMKRAKLKKQESLQRFLKARREKQEALKREVEQWKVVEV
jgi:hypothetical protein